MKQPEDKSTIELPHVQRPYLVVSTTKKGRRQFKRDHWLGSWNASWSDRLSAAHQFELEDLPKLLAYVFERRAVTVVLVHDGHLRVLGQSVYPTPA